MEVLASEQKGPTEIRSTPGESIPPAASTLASTEFDVDSVSCMCRTRLLLCTKEEVHTAAFVSVQGALFPERSRADVTGKRFLSRVLELAHG